MMNEDQTALVCDLAETYHIFDMRAYSARFIATLACGLKADSRIKTKMAGVQLLPPNSLLYALIVDEIRALKWALVGDKSQKPTYITELMEKGLPKKEIQGFRTAEEFERRRRELIERMNG